MTKEELINKINKTVDFLINGIAERKGQIYQGHPNFYVMHTKEEFDTELQSSIQDKDSYDRYDMFYYTNHMFKYMLNQYDSHTRMFFTDSKYLPMTIKIIDNKPYIIDTTESNNDIKGSQILKINDIDINTIISYLDNIICYASTDYLNIILEAYLTNVNTINSIPIINKSNLIKITTNKGEKVFDTNHLERFKDTTIKPNYNLEIRDNTAIITYNHCKDEDKMIKLVNQLNQLDNINNYIVDLRGNGGGDSSINRHLVDFLANKNVTVLSDERVFSSARMCYVNLKNNGAKIIGTNPGTPISCFGNNLLEKTYDDMNLVVTGSTRYWFYDENFKCHGVSKEYWDEAIKQRPDLLNAVFLNVDEKVELTLDDYLNKTDSVLDYAVNSFNQNKSR